MKHLALSRISHTPPPPGVGGGGQEIIGIWEKKTGLLVSEKTKIGIWPAEGRKILEI